MTSRNLIIVHRGPEYEADFEEIARKIVAIDPGITVIHLPAQLPVELSGAVWRRPTLTVALAPEFALRVERGPILQNRPLPKLTQQQVFRENGIPTLPALQFQFGMKLDPILLGEFVMLKPANLNRTSYGDGVHVMRRQRAESFKPADFSSDHPIRTGEQFLVQRFIPTGDRPNSYRVSTFLGEVLYMWRSEGGVSTPSLSAPDRAIEAADFTDKRQRTNFFEVNEDVLTLARLVAAAFPDIPLLGVDIIKDARTGKLYALEVNAGGNTWHFSSKTWAERRALRPDWALAMRTQFSAFDVAAQVLARKAQLLAA